MNRSFLRKEAQAIAALPLPWEKLAGRSIAVTGATGLIGGSFLRTLAEINEEKGLQLCLIALCRRPERMRIAGVQAVSYDALAELPAFEADFILHAASNAHPLAFSAEPVETLQANLLGSMRLLEKIRGGGRLLMCSTGEIYGEAPADAGENWPGFDEASFGAVDPMRARACYPEGKRAAEALCAAYHAQYGCDALAARLCYVYGADISPENSRADAQFLRRARAGEDIILKSDGSQLRSYCYAADAVSALLTLLLRGEAGQAYNIANPASVCTIREYAQTLADLAGVQLRFEMPPEEERRGYSAVSRAVLNPGKLMKLGWRAKYDLREGLRRALIG